MKISRLFIKPQSGMPVEAQQALMLAKGYGIRGDASAQGGSPRQILITDRVTLGQFGLQPGDLRENILLDTGFEGLQSGQVLQIGDALIRLTFLCEPCTYLNTLQPDLAKRIKAKRGWLGMVVTSGAIAVGDSVILSAHQFPALPHDAKGRFYELLARIPAGKVITTGDLIVALGVTPSHYRVFPSFIKQAPPELPVHRVVAIAGNLFNKHIPEQAERLAAEGIELQDGKVPSHYHLPAKCFHELGNVYL
uniref:MOSC domain-containing protein n=1 Tax=Oscillatoriales cyanobacterium SpSt-402 TaxID=2282168 RepID=A0A832H3T0_9CYAN